MLWFSILCLWISSVYQNSFSNPKSNSLPICLNLYTLTNTNRYEFSYIAENWSGNTFIVGFNATFNDSYYEPMEEYRVYKFKQIGRLLDLGLENEFWYTVISICLLFLVGAIFSSLTVEVGAVVTSGFAGVLNYIGWLSYPGDKALITTAIIISILIYMNKRAKEEGVA